MYIRYKHIGIFLINLNELIPFVKFRVGKFPLVKPFLVFSLIKLYFWFMEVKLTLHGFHQVKIINVVFFNSKGIRKQSFTGAL